MDAMANPSPEQISADGEKIYEERLRAILEPSQIGKFTAIEVVSGDYFVGDTLLDAVAEAQKRYPDCLFYTKRIGHRGVFKLGGYWRRLAI